MLCWFSSANFYCLFIIHLRLPAMQLGKNFFFLVISFQIKNLFISFCLSHQYFFATFNMWAEIKPCFRPNCLNTTQFLIYPLSLFLSLFKNPLSLFLSLFKKNSFPLCKIKSRCFRWLLFFFFSLSLFVQKSSFSLCKIKSRCFRWLLFFFFSLSLFVQKSSFPLCKIKSRCFRWLLFFFFSLSLFVQKSSYSLCKNKISVFLVATILLFFSFPLCKIKSRCFRWLLFFFFSLFSWLFSPLKQKENYEYR